jgi:hypothetical protein
MSKVTKELKKQAARAELAAQEATDGDTAEEFKTLASAFRAQARIIKDKKKTSSQRA